MTRNERIEAMAQAMMAGNWHVAPDFAREMFKGYAHLALAAADVEGMVRLGAQMARDFHAESIDAIVQSVMEGGQ